MNKKSFINNEIWILTFAGGFQRAKIYTGVIDEKQRSAYRQLLRNYIEELVAKHYQKNVSDAEHLEHINSIIAFSNSQMEFKENVKMNFGIAQKLLNLYLKYLWCLGELKIVPPHFPVDRIIHEELNKTAKDTGLKKFEIASWTQFDDEKHYLQIINFAKELTKIESYSHFNLAELELYLFERRNN